MIKSKTIDIPVFGYKVHLVLGDSHKAIQGYVETQHNLQLEDHENFSDIDRCYHGNTVQLLDTRESVMMGRIELFDLTILVHELTHVIGDIYEACSIKPTRDTEEVRAYINDYLFKEFKTIIE